MSVKAIFDKSAQAIITDIRSNMVAENVNATGRTSQSLEYSATETSMEIRGDKAFIWVERGRRPGRKPPFSPILEWVEARGIGGDNPVATAWRVVNSIGKRGSVTFRGAEFRDIYTKVVTDARVSAILNEVGAYRLATAKSNIVDAFKPGQVRFG